MTVFHATHACAVTGTCTCNCGNDVFSAANIAVSGIAVVLAIIIVILVAVLLKQRGKKHVLSHCLSNLLDCLPLQVLHYVRKNCIFSGHVGIYYFSCYSFV